MKRIINKILLKIMNKFNIPTMKISDEDYEQNLKEYLDTICDSNGKEFVVPSEYSKKLAKEMFGNKKGSGVN